MDTRSAIRRAPTVVLPAPRADGGDALGRAFGARRSAREFGPGALTLQEVSRLLWAGQGASGGDGLRTAPSAGALYPLELHLALGRVDGLEPGVYRYLPDRHRLAHTREGDVRRALAAAAWDQTWIADAAAVLVIAAVEQRTTRKYGGRGVRYVHFEAGHAAQNVALEAAALGLGTVTVGAFDDDRVGELLVLPEGEAPLYIMPLGRPRV